MRILMLHNRYRATGGEERAVENIVELLTRRGHAVRLLERDSAAVSRATAARALLSGGAAPEQVHAAAREFGAEIVHVHNVHPLFGWRALAAARAAGAGVVLHLHNFRLFCAIAVVYRDGRPCFDCRGLNTLPGLLHRCRGSVAESATYAAGLALQQRRLIAGADRFIAVSEFLAGRLVQLGLPAARTAALLHFAPAATIAPRSRAQDGGYALAYGRLVPEKGYDTAVAAAAAASVPLVIAGDGPDADRLRSLAAGNGAELRLVGYVNQQRLAQLRRDAAVCLVPSRSDEALGYTAIEALAAGLPVIGTQRGGVPELLAGQAALAPGDVAAWSAELKRLWANPDARAERGERALRTARGLLSEDRYHDGLLDTYERARAAALRRA